MRVCMVAYSFYENDNRVMRYATALAGRGDAVEVVALRKKRQPRHERINGVSVYRIQERVVNEKSKYSYLYRIMKFFLRSFLFVSLRHLRNPFDVVHVHSVPDFEVFAALVPKLLGARIILDIHDMVPEFYASKFDSGTGSLIYRMLIQVEQASTSFSDHVIIANHIWKEKLVSRCAVGDKCTALLNYPDTDVFKADARPGEPDRFIIIYPGSLNWHQGLDIAIRAMARIKEKAPQAELHIYGEGPEKNALKKLSGELGLDGKVIFRDFLPIKDIASVMAGAQLGIVPKRDDPFGGEAFSTKILEFMALGVPVVVSATKIDRHYFNDGLVRFFRPEDEESLAEALLGMIKDRGHRERLVMSALDFISRNSWEAKKGEYLSVVDAIVSARGKKNVSRQA